MSHGGSPAAEPPAKVLQPEVPSVGEHLAILGQKLDSLALQVDACLIGIQSVRTPGDHLPEANRTSIPQSLQVSSSKSSEPISATFRKSSEVLRQSTLPMITTMTPASSTNTPMSSPASRRPPFMLAGALESRARRASIGSFDGFMQQRRRKLNPAQQLVWKFLTDPESGIAASVYNRLNPAFILLVVALSLNQITSTAIMNPAVAMVVECAIEVFFLLEISVLFIVCPNRWHFFLRCYNIIDILSVMPLVLRLHCIMNDDSQEICTIIFGGVVPVLRLFKTLRRFQTFRLLTSAFLLAQEAIPVLLFYYGTVWLFFSVLVFVVEDRSNIQSLPEAMWLSFVSMTTLGYGDEVPKSGAGRLVVACLVMVSTLYMAIPLGIIGSCFSAVWSDRDCILLLERLRCCFAEIGCSHWDVPRLFSRFDKTKTGSLDALEFMNMATHLRLGLSEDRILRLFKLWANDEQGNRIEAAEFQQALFPTACLTTLAKQRREENTSRFSRGSTVVFESANEDRATLER